MKIKPTLELLPWVHKSKVKANGKAPLYIRITILGHPSKEVSVGSIAPKNWDVATKTVLKTEPEYRDINNRVTEISGELISIYKRLCIQYEEENVTPLMVRESYERKTKPASLPNQNQTLPFQTLPAQQTLNAAQQPLAYPMPPMPVPTGFPTNPYPFVNTAPFLPSQPVASNPVQEMQVMFATMQAQLHGFMQQMAAFGLQPTPFAPLNPIAELQQNYNHLLVQFNQFISSQSQAHVCPQPHKPESSNFSLMDGFTEFITRFEKLVEKGSRSDGTLRQWKSTKRKVIKFLQDKFHASDILYTEIMPDFGDILYDYFTLEVDRPLDDATAKKHIKKTKQILKIGIKKRVITVNPIADFVCGGDQKEVLPLELDEVYAIYKKDFGIERLNEVADAYIFQCFTGFAYQDLYNLTPENIILVGPTKERWLIKDRGKTGVSEMVPILPVVEELIEKYKNHPRRLVSNQLVPVDSNANYNGYLKEIAVICKINRELKTHLARHTFADIMLNLGVPLEDVSKMLGHKSIRTTQRYCRVNKERISRNMKQFVKHALFNNMGELKMVG